MAFSDCNMIFDVLYEGVIMMDAQRKITYWNLGAKRLTGYSSEEAISATDHDALLNHIDAHGRILYFEGSPLSESMLDGKVRELEIYIQHKRGHRIPVRLRTVPIVEAGKVVGMIEIFMENGDANHTYKTNARQTHPLLMDELTQLPGRVMVDQLITTKFNDFKTLGIPFGIAIVDLDNFEAINQTYGKTIGDEVLKLLSDSFIHCFKEAEMIGRWENDAFILIFTNISKTALITVCDKIRVVAEASVLRNTAFKEIDFSVSIGGSVVHADEEVQTLVNRAHNQLKKAKIRGGNNSVVK